MRIQHRQQFVCHTPRRGRLSFYYEYVRTYFEAYPWYIIKNETYTLAVRSTKNVFLIKTQLCKLRAILRYVHVVQQRNSVPPCARGPSRMVEALKLATGEAPYVLFPWRTGVSSHLRLLCSLQYSVHRAGSLPNIDILLA